MEIRIQSIHFTADKKLLDYTEKKISKLEHFFNHIIDVDVYLKFNSAHSQIKEKSANLRMRVPGTTLDAEENSATFEEAIDKAVESLKRQLKRHKEKLKN
ncbi:MAG TPA: ribosome-associated translation inhibitor RaiA [Chitinophagales bacterium]|nr:ribosome-associated translation inhibitor RaiA [Chitinophagales bacterium]